MSDGELLVAARAFIHKQDVHYKAFYVAITNGEGCSADEEFHVAWDDMIHLSDKYADNPVAVAFKDWNEKVNTTAQWRLNPDGTDEPVSKAVADKITHAWEDAWNNFVSVCTLRSI